MSSTKLIKAYCEIDGCNVTDPRLLELHHIICRTDPNTTNTNNNIAILCANHHTLLHTNDLVIYGIVPSTKLPNKRILVYELYGNKNIDISIEELEAFKPKRKSYKI